MVRIEGLKLAPGQDEQLLRGKAARLLRMPEGDILSLQVLRRAIDAREELHFVYTAAVTLRQEKAALRRVRDRRVTPYTPEVYRLPETLAAPETPPVVIGAGPGGLFAALVLARCGLRPIVLERGQDAVTRQRDVASFWRTGVLDPESNVQFGEGGAGTFSDGKLNTGTKNERGRWVLEQFVRAGAQEEILYDAKPHVGTDVLFEVVQNLRRRIESLGGEVRFGAKLTGLSSENGRLTGAVYCQNGEETQLPCDALILAVGHSARDTFRWLSEMKIPMEPKPFSMGARIEHPQTQVDLAQYGKARGTELPPADYKLSCHLPDGSSAYTFCMCPGGFVVAAASQPGGIATNGMSLAARDGENANAALLVTLHPEDFPYPGALGGMLWQEEIERRAFEMAGESYCAPAQTVGDFLAHRPSKALGKVAPTYRPGVTLCDLHELLPEKLTHTMEQAIVRLDGALSGFADPQAVLTAPETRSSSPVRILRGEDRQSALRGLFPCGEGAGYAGGILSAAVDGMLCAEAVLQQT